MGKFRQKIKDTTAKNSAAMRGATSKACIEELDRLDERRNQGLIDDEEYAARRKILRGR